MPSDSLSGVALVTGGGRGIGASIARELAEAGMHVAVTGRTTEQVDAVADEIRGLARRRRRAPRGRGGLGRPDREGAGPIDLLAANAGNRKSGWGYLGGPGRRLVGRVPR